MTTLLKIFAIVFLQVVICKKATKNWFGLIIPVICAISSLNVMITMIAKGAITGALPLFIMLFNDYTIDFIITFIIHIFYKKEHPINEEPAVTMETKANTQLSGDLKELSDAANVFKDKHFISELKTVIKDSIISSTAFMIIGTITMVLIMFTVGIFLLMDEAGDMHKERLAEDAKTTYNGYVYKEFIPEEDSLWYTGEYVNLVNLEVEPLAYTCETRIGFDKPEKDYYLSTINNIEAPTEEYTLSYHVCSNVDAFYIDKAEQKFLDDFEGTPVEPQFDYGADTAYWLDDELLLRYGDNHLLYFYDDTTEELINNEDTAAFMRDNMLLEKPFEKDNPMDYVFGKKGAKQE